MSGYIFSTEDIIQYSYDAECSPNDNTGRLILFLNITMTENLKNQSVSHEDFREKVKDAVIDNLSKFSYNFK